MSEKPNQWQAEQPEALPVPYLVWLFVGSVMAVFAYTAYYQPQQELLFKEMIYRCKLLPASCRCWVVFTV